MNEIQEELLDILVFVDKVMRENDIPYFIDAGTAIGAVRHGGFIPWDDDIDINIYRKDVDRFVKAFENVEGYYLQKPFTKDWLKRFYRIRKNGTTVLEIGKLNYTRMHQGLPVDVFVLEDYPDSPTARKLYRWMSNRMVDLEDKYAERSWLSYSELYYFYGKCTIKLLMLFTRLMSLGKCSEVTKLTPNFEKTTWNKEKISELTEVGFEGYSVWMTKNYDYFLRTQFGDYMTPPPEDERIGHCFYYYRKVDHEIFMMRKKRDK